MIVIIVIPNRAESPVRNLLFPGPSRAAVGLGEVFLQEHNVMTEWADDSVMTANPKKTPRETSRRSPHFS
jgi:hypothetical protein